MARIKDNNQVKRFDKISIGLASPESILAESRGEVLKPETINYRTHKPERDGLFCERIFGPVKDYECACGKYKRIRYRGIVCDRCGVEVTEKKVRRDRVGHINLVVPVAHIWYFRSLPNKIGYLLGLPSKKLDMIIYYERYVVIQPGIAKGPEGEEINKMDFLTEEEYLNILDTIPQENQYLEDTDPNKFIAKMGAECLIDLLGRINLKELSFELRHKANTETSKQRKTEALKRLQVVEALRESQENRENEPEWMIMKVIPVIPPELRPLVPLDGGRFATSDLNDLYRRVIIRNNRLKRLVEIKAPEVILRNEKRMLQEAVDSLFDNTRKASAVKTESNRPLKSLSDSLKGKQGRFRQNLLGKRVDYSARSVIVVGPELNLYECGLPKDMAAELYKPFVIRKLIERGIVKTVKSAKKIIDKKEPVVWDILENVLKGHPVLLNRAPTLHRLGIQAFQPKLIEGKAIRLHPLACTAFNADFDGDQMAVHLPLGPEAILEAQLLMLASQNILNPANGSPITVPSQDMVLGLYYMTKERKSTPEVPIIGEGLTFYSAEEVEIAFNEGKVNLNAGIKVRAKDFNEEGELVNQIIPTTVGRVLFNKNVPEEAGYINQVLNKKALRNIIGDILAVTSVPATAAFLDKIKTMGYEFAFKGGLSFSLGDIIIPAEKMDMIGEANGQVDGIMANYNMGLITNNERYNQVIDVWTSTNAMLTELAMKRIREDQQGFNSVYMMLDSGARGSKEQIRQLTGMRGLMAKPKKSTAGGGEIIENPILSNFKEGLSILEYFISTHGARKGLADTALKTADAGYLTRRLVDVSQDVIINTEDCETLRGVEVQALKKNEEVVESLGERILGRVSLHDVYNPMTEELVLQAGQQIMEADVKRVEASPIEKIEVRSALTCEAEKGICAKCYGRNLSTNKMVQRGEAVGVVAAQSIGEPGTQLTLRTFHVGGIAGNISEDNKLEVRFSGIAEIEDLRTVTGEGSDGKPAEIVISRTTEIKVVDAKTGITLSTSNIPYGSQLFVENGAKVEKGDVICSWDPYNGVIVSEFPGKIAYENIEQGVTYQVEIDEQTGFQEKVISESRNKKLIPTLLIQDAKGETLRSYNLPVGSHIMVDDGDKIKEGKTLVKIPRKSAKAGDITGGLPRVTELFEARNPSNPAVVSEIDGVVSFGKIKRGNREIIIESKLGEVKKYLVKLSNQILVQENDYVRAGMPLSDGSITPEDILAIKGPSAVQQYLVNEVQEVYRLQGVKINDKHFEVVVRQMMRKVRIQDPGDTIFLENQLIHKDDFIKENDEIFGKKVVMEAGDSDNLKPGQIVTPRELRDENSLLRRGDKALVEARDAVSATATPILQGITRASLQTKSFISAASFQETTKVLNEAAVSGKVDTLEGLKENVIVGHKIPAGTGMRDYDSIIVGSKEEYDEIMARKEALRF
ncbi:MAG: DNA-directed RNA polymerase subunit beta' [Maribacter dokdonensis]|uniref:DNA-directed RNA polymerase subunit beta' n=3 Tax=Maribacter dokdonensis TaxID=320912 RepID=A0A1H4J961_9FLAO|nr:MULTISPECIES: DNA-directed RNA polymerase subunit beta' [Maribacter]APA63410.1 DNA-directed RNA polymerase subunit beta' [Maribacter sp. 1_2014MBL_MicDiv]KSA11747.1 DNA-directed RNA polymerase subunit beta' [Maribacter dokdonensis DSW-8]MBU2899398.1 DNA-directed RNA polymerase subunit beta' [Maribacter dokdonensis]PHN93067.1 DNA-directed RNA polymerase subunit beta' [Maribacter sp. 6B07]CAG2531831.1 DNA-directed RNA polymerase subunit beta' [Maribacter dokdonensis]|tara:strand:+ start:88231 stop:92529 length:4299 start_codon:yes stop_codon:yes gene_type:complete